MSLVLIRVSGSNRQVDVPQSLLHVGRKREERALGDVAISAERVTITRTPMGSEAVKYFRACAQQSHHLHGTHSRRNKLSLGGCYTRINQFGIVL